MPRKKVSKNKPADSRTQTPGEGYRVVVVRQRAPALLTATVAVASVVVVALLAVLIYRLALSDETGLASPGPQMTAAPVEQNSSGHGGPDPRIEAAIAGGAVYVGQDICAECHREQAERMSRLRMSRAIERLQGADLQNSRCLGCHTTGLGQPLAAGLAPTDMVNVQCEACHGPGSKYVELMRSGYQSGDPAFAAKAAEAGLLARPDKTTCLQCHHDEPGQPPWQYEQHREFIKHWDEF